MCVCVPVSKHPLTLGCLLHLSRTVFGSSGFRPEYDPYSSVSRAEPPPPSPVRRDSKRERKVEPVPAQVREEWWDGTGQDGKAAGRDVRDRQKC